MAALSFLESLNRTRENLINQESKRKINILDNSVLNKCGLVRTKSFGWASPLDSDLNDTTNETETKRKKKIVNEKWQRATKKVIAANRLKTKKLVRKGSGLFSEGIATTPPTTPGRKVINVREIESGLRRIPSKAWTVPDKDTKDDDIAGFDSFSSSSSEECEESTSKSFKKIIRVDSHAKILRRFEEDMEKMDDHVEKSRAAQLIKLKKRMRRKRESINKKNSEDQSIVEEVEEKQQLKKKESFRRAGKMVALGNALRKQRMAHAKVLHGFAMARSERNEHVELTRAQQLLKMRRRQKKRRESRSGTASVSKSKHAEEQYEAGYFNEMFGYEKVEASNLQKGSPLYVWWEGDDESDDIKKRSRWREVVVVCIEHRGNKDFVQVQYFDGDGIGMEKLCIESEWIKLPDEVDRLGYRYEDYEEDSEEDGDSPENNLCFASTWTTEQVSRFLNSIGLSLYSDKLRLDGKSLLLLDNLDAVKEAGISIRIHQKKLLREIDKLKNTQKEIILPQWPGNEAALRAGRRWKRAALAVMAAGRFASVFSISNNEENEKQKQIHTSNLQVFDTDNAHVPEEDYSNYPKQAMEKAGWAIYIGEEGYPYAHHDDYGSYWMLDDDNGTPFYTHVISGESLWELPGVEEAQYEMTLLKFSNIGSTALTLRRAQKKLMKPILLRRQKEFKRKFSEHAWQNVDTRRIARLEVPGRKWIDDMKKRKFRKGVKIIGGVVPQAPAGLSRASLLERQLVVEEVLANKHAKKKLKKLAKLASTNGKKYVKYDGYFELHCRLQKGLADNIAYFNENRLSLHAEADWQHDCQSFTNKAVDNNRIDEDNLLNIICEIIVGVISSRIEAKYVDCNLVADVIDDLFRCVSSIGNDGKLHFRSLDDVENLRNLRDYIPTAPELVSESSTPELVSESAMFTKRIGSLAKSHKDSFKIIKKSVRRMNTL